MRNAKGFTLIELLAVIIISTTVLVPLLSGLIGNFEVNKRMHARKAASSITLTTLSAFEKVHFDNLDNQLGDDLIVEITQNDCDEFTFDVDNPYRIMPSDEVCMMIFEQEWNSIQFTGEETFKVFLYPYHLTENEIDTILGMESVPDRVKNEIDELTPSDDTDEDILRMSVWIEYDEDSGQDIAASGVVSRE